MPSTPPGPGPGQDPGRAGPGCVTPWPPVITWLVRLMSLLPALMWILALAAPGRGTPHQAAGPPAWAFALAAAGAIALTAAVERLQLLVLRGRDPASAPAGPALGDAFRAQTALDLPMLAAGPACVTAILLISPLLTATRGSHYGDALFTGYLMVLPGAPLTLLLLRATPWARQYYQKRHPASLAAPPGPASAQNPG